MARALWIICFVPYVPPAELAAIIVCSLSAVVTAATVAFVCWKYPSCRKRKFWDKNIKYLLRKLNGVKDKVLSVIPRPPTFDVSEKVQKIRKKSEDRQTLLLGPLIKQKEKDEATKFVVPQIMVDYGSRRQSYASDYLRRSSGDGFDSRRTSLMSTIYDWDRRGSNSSQCSRRTSLASDWDHRGSLSSQGSRRTSLLSDFSDRRGSGSSKSSRKSSDASAKFFDDQELYYDYDSEPVDTAGYISGKKQVHFRRLSYEDDDPAGCPVERQLPAPYRRCHSLAEIGEPVLNEAQATARLPPSPPVRGPGTKAPQKVRAGRRMTLHSLVVSSINALDCTPNPVAPPVGKKKKISRQSTSGGSGGTVGLPDFPVVMHDLNLEEMMPKYVPPMEPTGRLKVQVQFADDKKSLNCVIIEAAELGIAGLPKDADVNPYVKAFLVPGRTFKYRTKTLSKEKNPLFLERFCIKDITPEDITDESTIEFQVYSSHQLTRRHLVGVAALRLAEIEGYDSGVAELHIMPQTIYKLHQGDLRISGCYQPVAGKIVFNIMEARNLPRISLLGAINPYVKAEMYVNGIRVAKHKTKIRQNTQDPLWHHNCVFEINRENPKLLGHVFVFTVLHKDMMTGVHKIGQVDLGWYSHGIQLEHWYELMEHPHRSTDIWHPVIKTGKIIS